MAKRLKQILLLENNRDLRGVFVDVFSEWDGYSTFAVNGIPEALGTACRETFEAAIVDLGSGAEISDRLEMIKTWRNEGHAFPIIVTGSHALCEPALAAGGDDFLRRCDDPSRSYDSFPYSGESEIEP
jgi:CheY-like chemotaxis protein